MPQICNFIFDDNWPDFVNKYVCKQNDFHLHGMRVIHENSKIYIPEKFVQVRYV